MNWYSKKASVGMDQSEVRAAYKFLRNIEGIQRVYQENFALDSKNQKASLTSINVYHGPAGAMVVRFSQDRHFSADATDRVPVDWTIDSSNERMVELVNDGLASVLKHNEVTA